MLNSEPRKKPLNQVIVSLLLIMAKYIKLLKSSKLVMVLYLIQQVSLLVKQMNVRLLLLLQDVYSHISTVNVAITILAILFAQGLKVKL
jgi:hypothetical protein